MKDISAQIRAHNRKIELKKLAEESEPMANLILLAMVQDGFLDPYDAGGNRISIDRIRRILVAEGVDPLEPEDVKYRVIT